MNNCIFDDRNNNSIGFYGDLYNGIKEQGVEFMKQGDYEQVQTSCEILELLEKLKDFDGLIVISENNGMGWTCEKYVDYSKRENYTI